MEMEFIGVAVPDFDSRVRDYYFIYPRHATPTKSCMKDVKESFCNLTTYAVYESLISS